MKKIDIIVPVYNEQESIELFITETNKIINQITNYKFEYLFVNDGSKDNTLLELKRLYKNHNNINIVSFSRNFGKEQALIAGIKNCSADACIIMDVDLQDPPSVIPSLIKEWENNYKNIYGVREDRNSDNFFKRKTSELFYILYNVFCKVKIPYNAGDYRLLDQKIISSISQINDKNLFMKGVYAWSGYPSIAVFYKREKRALGSTKFNAFNLLRLALDAIFSSSALPLKFASYIGLIIAIVSFIFGLVIIYNKVMYGNPIRGYPSIMATMLFFFGIVFMFIGLLGEYISRIYDEVKQRPSFIIEETIKSKSI